MPLQRQQLAVAAAGFERGRHEVGEVRVRARPDFRRALQRLAGPRRDRPLDGRRIARETRGQQPRLFVALQSA